MPIPKGTFPERFKEVALHDCLMMHHIKIQDKSRVMEEIQKAMIDQGGAEYTTAGAWEYLVGIQDDLDEAMVTDPAVYADLTHELTQREVIFWAEKAALDYQVERRDDIDPESEGWYPEMLDRVLDSLEISGHQDDDEWIDLVTDRYANYGFDQEVHLKRNNRFFSAMEEAHSSGDIDTYRDLLEKYSSGGDIQ